MSATVLIVDDAVFMRNILRAIIKDKGYTVIAEAASGIEAMRSLHDHSPDIVLLDIILPDVNGLDLLDSILKIRPQARVVICSSIGQEPIIKKALDHGAKAFIQKPFTPEKVLAALENLEA
jgi:two-component system chemotaxis response regulator CheY